MDPTLGQDSVDATHIKLTESEREDPFKLMEFVGRVDIEFRVKLKAKPPHQNLRQSEK
ncbi:MAG: hypothetical protein QGI90_02020 [Nitrospinaceae bacterium]|nr:hypothetical protein [Nitrospinaceae bacterium]MDP7147449.1 hypothetical protein [Nitrospinaceae bacterium]